MITFPTAFIQTQGVLSLGDFYQGGLITYLSGSYPDQHGIIMATTNAPVGSLRQSPTNGKVPFWGTNNSVSGTFSSTINGGSTNTQLMLSSSFTSGSYTSGSATNRAVNEADVFTLNGYDDWVIPSNDELLAIWNTLAVNNIGGPYSIYSTSGGGTGLDRQYWTSTQYSATEAYAVQLQEGPLTPGGLLVNTLKSTILNLRLIRYF
jgi:hypothetical protein